MSILPSVRMETYSAVVITCIHTAPRTLEISLHNFQFLFAGLQQLMTPLCPQKCVCGKVVTWIN